MKTLDEAIKNLLRDKKTIPMLWLNAHRGDYILDDEEIEDLSEQKIDETILETIKETGRIFCLSFFEEKSRYHGRLGSLMSSYGYIDEQEVSELERSLDLACQNTDNREHAEVSIVPKSEFSQNGDDLSDFPENAKNGDYILEARFYKSASGYYPLYCSSVQDFFEKTIGYLVSIGRITPENIHEFKLSLNLIKDNALRWIDDYHQDYASNKIMTKEKNDLTEKWVLYYRESLLEDIAQNEKTTKTELKILRKI